MTNAGTSVRTRRRIAGERRPQRDDIDNTGTGTPAPTTPAPTRARAAPPPAVEPDRATEPDKRAETATARRSSWSPSWRVVAVLGAVTAVVVATALILGLGVWDIRGVRAADRVDEASRTAPAAAERASAAILSYDYSTLDADEKAAEGYMTPAYAKKYAASSSSCGPTPRS